MNAGETTPEYMRLLGAGPGLALAPVSGNVNSTGKNAAVAMTLAAPVPGYAPFGLGEIEGTMSANGNVSGINERVYVTPAVVGDHGSMDVGGNVARIASMTEGQRAMHPGRAPASEKNQAERRRGTLF